MKKTILERKKNSGKHSSNKYTIIPGKYFLKQLNKFDKHTKQILKEKIKLIKENPYRFKKLTTSHKYRLYRIRLSIQRKESRLIYCILTPQIIILCILDRKHNYKNLETHLKELEKQKL